MKNLSKKQLLKYAGLGILCLILLPIFPLVLGIYIAYRLYKGASNRKRGMGLAVLTMVISFFLTGVTVSAFPSSKSQTTTSPTPTTEVAQNANGEAKVDTTASTPEPNTGSQAQVGQTENATVVKVVDGDTLDVSLNGKTERIRVIGVNTPETVDPRKSVECFGVEASNKAKSYLAVGSEVQLEADASQDDRDKYQRLLRYIWLAGKDFGKMMIAEGYAYEYTYDIPYKYQNEYKQAQKDAEVNKKGLWADNACLSTPKPATPKLVATTAPSSGSSGAYTGSYSCSGPDLDCSDFATHSQAQSFFDSCGFSATYDPMKLDSVGVGDGVACESLP